jgi:hypothetical protein
VAQFEDAGPVLTPFYVPVLMRVGWCVIGPAFLYHL